MKVAILSESSADEAALRIIVDGILGTQTQPEGSYPLRSRGWPAVLNVLPAMIKHLYYRTDADAFAVVIDSNGSVAHGVDHDKPEQANDECRLCLVRKVVSRVTGQLRPGTGRDPLRIAVGLAVPAIEAWFRSGVDPHASEVAWMRKLKEGTQSRGYIAKLKRDVYGTYRPSSKLAERRAVEEADRLVKNLNELEKRFPNGFGPFAKSVREWS